MKRNTRATRARGPHPFPAGKGWGTHAAVMLVVAMLGLRAGGEARGAQPREVDTAGLAAVRVEVAKPVRRPMVRLLRMPASLLPGEKADLYAKTSGYVATVAVDIGSRVKKGDLLLTIDVPEMIDELHQAQAVLEAKRAKVHALQAKARQAASMVVTAGAEVQRFAAERELWQVTVDRKKQLRDENAIPEQDFDEARSRLAVVSAQSRIAEAQVESAKAKTQALEADVAVAEAQVAVEQARIARLRTLMKYATLRAPFDGVITGRFVDPGAFVRSAAEGTTTPLLTIVNDGYIRLALDIPESDAPFVRIGTEVEVDATALNQKPIHATVTRTAMVLKADTRTMRAEVDLDNRDSHLAPGMYARVNVKLESKEQALVIPSKAVRVRGKHTSVLVADGSQAQTKDVRIGYDDGIWAEVLSGLHGDERIIVSSSGALTPGARITAVPVDAS